jgi:hypothetical protein
VTWAGWAKQLLGGLGIETTADRLVFLHAWANAEGGTATYNPLNTTLPLPGATDYNRAHVKNYLDALQGTAATMLTLRLHFYDHLRAALGEDGLTPRGILARSGADLDTWGTGSRNVAKRIPR